MEENLSTQRVEVRCVGSPPVLQIERAAGVSDVTVSGPVVRCRLTGSFQPFLEALRGHEVILLLSAPVLDAPKIIRKHESSMTEGHDQ